MLKYPCLVLDHDDTVVQSEETVNFPYFCEFLDKFRPGTRITLAEYIHCCCHQSFAEMCRDRFHLTDDEMVQEFNGWKAYIQTHTPPPYPGIAAVIKRQKAQGGLVCVVSHSSAETIARDYQTHFDLLPDEIFGWEYPAHQRKPSPYPLEQIMQKYDLSPQQLLVVDDLKPAYDMASKVGVPIAFAQWSKTKHPELCAAMTSVCDYTFSSPKELEQFLFDV